MGPHAAPQTGMQGRIRQGEVGRGGAAVEWARRRGSVAVQGRWQAPPREGRVARWCGMALAERQAQTRREGASGSSPECGHGPRATEGRASVGVCCAGDPASPGCSSARHASRWYKCLSIEVTQSYNIFSSVCTPATTHSERCRQVVLFNTFYRHPAAASPPASSTQLPPGLPGSGSPGRSRQWAQAAGR